MASCRLFLSLYRPCDVPVTHLGWSYMHLPSIRSSWQMSICGDSGNSEVDFPEPGVDVPVRNNAADFAIFCTKNIVKIVTEKRELPIRCHRWHRLPPVALVTTKLALWYLSGFSDVIINSRRHFFCFCLYLQNKPPSYDANITGINPEAFKRGDDRYDRLLCTGLQPGPPSETPGGLEGYWSVSAVTWPPKLELRRWRSSGPSSLMKVGQHWHMILRNHVLLLSCQ